MVEIHNVRAVLRSTRSDAVVLVITAVATVAFDLIVAVEIGVVVAAMLALRIVARSAVAAEERVELDLGPYSRPATLIPRGDAEVIDQEAEAELLAERIVVYRLDGALFFGAAQRFLTELTDVADVKVVILRLPQLQVLDATGAQALGEIVSELESRGITVLLKGARPEHLRTLSAVGALDELASEHHVFDRLDDAVAHARSHLGLRARSAGGAVSVRANDHAGRTCAPETVEAGDDDATHLPSQS
jgi:SulP family sulfate permease